MKDAVAVIVIVVFGQDMVPGARREMLERNAGRVPRGGTIVEDAPLVGDEICLPAKVVDPAVKLLLAFELDALRSILRSAGNIEIKLVSNRVELPAGSLVLLVPIHVGVRNGRRDGKLRGRAVFTGRCNIRHHGRWRNRARGI